MPERWDEWCRVHKEFLSILKRYNVGFAELPPGMPSVDERVQYVLEYWKVSGDV